MNHGVCKDATNRAGYQMQVTGWLVGAVIVRGILNVVIEILDDSGRKKRRRYKVRSGRVSEHELKEWMNTLVCLTIVGGLVDDIFPQ